MVGSSPERLSLPLIMHLTFSTTLPPSQRRFLHISQPSQLRAWVEHYSYIMIWRFSLISCLALVSAALAADPSQNKPNTPQPQADQNSPPGGQTNPAANVPDSSNSRKDPSFSAASSANPVGSTFQRYNPSESIFGAGCRWDPTTSNIKQVSFDFRTGQAPPSTWFSDVHDAATETAASKLTRRDASPETHHDAKPVLDSSYHTRLIDVLTFRARFGSFGSSLNSAGCALPAFSERLAQLEVEEGEIVNNYTRQHKSDDVPNAMFFWAGISNYDPNVRSDLIQTVVFYGDGCAANPRQGLCVYAAEYSNFRYSPEDHMCMGSNMPVFYPVDTTMTVVYRTQNGFRTQESWIDGKMVSYLRSAGDQVMNSFVITQECKGCTWPLSEQVYSNIVIKFSEPEPHFAALGLCTGGAKLKSPPRMEDGGKRWVIEEVRVPSGEHPTGSTNTQRGSNAEGGPNGRQAAASDAGANGDKTDADAASGYGNGGSVSNGGGVKNDQSRASPANPAAAPGTGGDSGNNGDQSVKDGQSDAGEQRDEGANTSPPVNGSAQSPSNALVASGAAPPSGVNDSSGAPAPNGVSTGPHSSRGREVHDAHMAHMARMARQHPPTNGGVSGQAGSASSNGVGGDASPAAAPGVAAQPGSQPQPVPNAAGTPDQIVAGSAPAGSPHNPNTGNGADANITPPTVGSAGTNTPASDSKPKDNNVPPKSAAKPDPAANHTP